MRSVQPLVVQSQDSQPPAISVIIPARNEAHNIVLLIEELRQQIRTIDEIVVVDDGSTDNTLQLARAAGAKVISAGALPGGWAEKAHACWVGAEAALNDVLVFVDADVRFNTANKYIVRSLASSVVSQPTVLFSVQPWHNTVQIGEQASMLFNIVSVMGSGMKTSKPLVFGPLLACMREVYFANQGH